MSRPVANFPLLACGVALLFAAGGPAEAQSLSIATSHQSYTFDNPRVVGLEGFSMTASRVHGSYLPSPSLEVGGTAHLARTSIVPLGRGEMGLQGLTDVEVFVGPDIGPFLIRVGFAPRLASADGTGELLVVGGLTATEALPFPVRGWAQTSRLRLDATIRTQTERYTFDVLAGLRRHGSFEPFENQSLAYRPGMERRVGLRLHRWVSAISWFEFGGLVSSIGSDTSLGIAAYDPGIRARAHLAGFVAAGPVGFLFRSGAYHRASGATIVPPSTLGAPESAIVGLTDTEPRTVFEAGVETMGSIFGAPLTTEVAGRFGKDDAKTWLVSVGLETEIEVRPPAPGRWFVRPSGKLTRGRFALGRRPLTSFSAWEVGATVHWEGS